MILAFAIAGAAVFGAATVLVLSRDLVRIVAGIVLFSQSGVLVVIASGLTRGDAPIIPFDEVPSDPLVQAMALTAIVIGLALTALLLAIVARVRATLRSAEIGDLVREEAQESADLERTLDAMYERLDAAEERAAEQ